ncbi:MAG: rhodanese-like domain-containing protein [Betaproteobacteria bacterium]|jgi:rhodanese-related sulfurtransferase
MGLNDFISSNLWLVLALVVSGGYLVFPRLRPGSTSYKEVGALEAVQLINGRKALPLDIRDEKAFLEGSIVGAKNIPLANLASDVGKLEKFVKRPVIILCATGHRSKSAVRALKSAGSEEIFVLKGGLSAWSQAGMPLSKVN